MAPAAQRLSELLGVEVKLATDTVGPSAAETVAALADGDVAMLENVRFEPGETSKDEAERQALADKYAAFGDFFVSDGFGVVHRKQASVYELAKKLPSAAGSLVEGIHSRLIATHCAGQTPLRPQDFGLRSLDSEKSSVHESRSKFVGDFSRNP